MCGRFTLKTDAAEVAEVFRLEEPPALAPRYNIAPTQAIAAVRRAPDGPARALDFLHWGLVPAWAGDPAVGSRMINARCETVFEKPAFRDAVRLRRCLVPADGFFEWQSTSPARQPFWIRMKDGRLFALAAIWERWEPRTGPPIQSCAVLTTPANELVAPLHDRMPAIVAPSDFELWLDPDVREPERISAILQPFPAAAMVSSAVSARVNDVRNDDPRCLAAAPVQGTFGFP